MTQAEILEQECGIGRLTLGEVQNLVSYLTSYASSLDPKTTDAGLIDNVRALRNKIRSGMEVY